MDFLYKTITTVLLGCILFTIPGEIYLWVFVLTGIISWEFILMILFGKIDFNFKSNKAKGLEDIAIRFNDVHETELYITDVRASRKALLLDKGYVIDVVTDSKETGLWMNTLRYGSRSERDKDHEALMYKLKAHGLYREKRAREQKQ